MRFVSALLLLAASLASAAAQAGSITDLSQWRLVEDPPDGHFSGSADTNTATLTASGGPIPSGTDIGFQSVDGNTVASSGAGFYFSPDQSFALAIDFSLAFGTGAGGTLGIGFGIGEDIDGADSAGVAMLTNNGTAFGTFSAAGRVGDSNQIPVPISVSAALEGSMFVTYDALTGDVSLGASQTRDAAVPGGSATYTGIQNNWDDDGLLVSMFLRSQEVDLRPILFASAWQSGDAEAVFSNLRVLSGTPIPIAPAGVAPLPPSLALLAPGLLLLRPRRRAQQPKTEARPRSLS